MRQPELPTVENEEPSPFRVAPHAIPSPFRVVAPGAPASPGLAATPPAGTPQPVIAGAVEPLVPAAGGVAVPIGLPPVTGSAVPMPLRDVRRGERSSPGRPPLTGEGPASPRRAKKPMGRPHGPMALVTIEPAPARLPVRLRSTHNAARPSRLVPALAIAALVALLVASPWMGRELRRLWRDSSSRAVEQTRKPVAPKKVAKAAPAEEVVRREPFWVDRSSVGKPYGDKVRGLLTFRGNPTRTYYGEGPVPRRKPRIVWDYPRRPMCAVSRDLGKDYVWCGTGWTGQPAVFERDGRTWVVFGAYDRAVHFVDADTGKDIIPPFVTGDIIKGSVTIDPDGYPIVYTGSRDNYFRAISFDGPRPRELWRLSAFSVKPTLWNDDWDGAALVLDDHLFVGGENSQFHVVKLNRDYDGDGRATVKPRLIFNTPGWDKDQIARLPDRNVSIENSVAMFEGKVFFANSGGLAQGWDLRGLAKGKAPKRLFRYWTGDDVDASIVVDKDGSLFVGAEYERGNKRAKEVGQIMKLAPGKKDPLLWSHKDAVGRKSGLWATPALYKDLVVVATHSGDLMGLDKDTSKKRWEIPLRSKTWQSPVIVDGVLIQGDCKGRLRAYDVADTKAQPRLLWTVRLPGCIESTPAVWNGRIYVGTRGGFVYALGDEP